ncbi:MAG: energy-coupling factor ABC transporter permease [Janthinobacterium lividum]
MGFLYASLPLWIAVGGWAAAAVALAIAIWRRPLNRLRNHTLQHLWLGTIVIIAVLWALDAWLQDGPVFHLLGATLMVTLFDWALAVVGMVAVIGLVAAIFGAPLDGIGLTMVVFGALPVVASVLLQRAIVAWLPRHLMVFILGHGFLCAAAAVLCASAAAAALHGLMHRDVFVGLPPGYAWVVLLLAAGEAWFTGMMTAILAVYKPAWVTTYNERMYHLDR